MDRHLHTLMKQITPLRTQLKESEKKSGEVDAKIQHYQELMERQKKEGQEDMRRVEYKAKEVRGMSDWTILCGTSVYFLSINFW